MASKPFTVSRTIEIDAPDDLIYALVADFRNWPGWSPWEDRDPQMFRAFEGTPLAPRSSYSWQGNRDAGSGKVQVLTPVPPSSVSIDFDLTKPRKFNALLMFLISNSRPTRVEWLMSGESDGLMQVVSAIRSMDSVYGPEFERGLARLKIVAEQRFHGRR